MAVLEITIQRMYEGRYPVVAEYSQPGELAQRSEGSLALDETLFEAAAMQPSFA